MNTSTDTHDLTPAEQARVIPTTSAVTNVVVRAAGIVGTRLDLAHVGTPEQHLGLSLGTVLIYLHSAFTARKIADGWAAAAVQAHALSPALVARRPVLTGPSTVAVRARLVSSPHVIAELHPGRAAICSRPAVSPVLVVVVGPMTWHVCDQTAYSSILRAWRQAARLLGDNPTEDDE